MEDGRHGVNQAFFASFGAGPYLVGDFSPYPLLTPSPTPYQAVEKLFS